MGHRRRVIMFSSAVRLLDRNPGWSGQLDRALRNEGARTEKGGDAASQKEGKGFAFPREDELN